MKGKRMPYKPKAKNIEKLRRYLKTKENDRSTLKRGER